MRGFSRLLCLQSGLSFLVYAVFLAYTYTRFGIFDMIAADFLQFYASGQILLHEGAAKIYDLAVQAQYQQQIFASYLRHPDQAPMPLHNPPVFVLLFLPFSLLPAMAGLLLWRAVSVALWVLVCFRLGRIFGFRPWPLFAVAFSFFPIFADFFWAQAWSLLTLALTEAFIAFKERKEGKAGLWLAFLLFKPQYILPLLLFLALKKRARALLSFGVAAVA